MKPTITIVLASLLTITSAHSWLHCTSFNNTDLIKWMEGNATESNGKMILDPIFPEWAHLCSGFSRYKANPGNWINESSAYAWSPSIHNSTHACHPDQRAPIQLLKFNETGHSDHYNPAPMATARAGGSIKLMFGGNGHSRGDFGGVQKSGPGMVRVYWKGGVEREIVRVRELTKKNLLQENGFAEESYVWPPDKNVTKAPAMKDKGNWQTVWLPKGMEPGRHMMVWVWSIQGDQPSWTTCFDVMIEDHQYEARKLRSSVHHLSVQYELLKHENEGLKEALQHKKKHRKKGKALDLQQRQEYHGGSVFWSPRKLREARAREAVRERDETEEKLQKARSKKQREEARLQRQDELEERRVERQRLKEMRELERAEKAAERARQKEERDAAKAIQLPQKGKRRASAATSSNNKRQKRVEAARAGAQVQEEPPAPPSKLTSRGRNVNLPSKYR
ncbi:DUF4670 multi-domain protein [Pyrenophora tritici-repentis]|uniref:DUF4670 multi-domain protein n=1 Tax=Pyrenophora tritici-repentis TaxID=45151 RepID=A0A922NM69_9PLEO|nr:DUF4670 multi-domain protein [Pyrenophora tritici-repentis]KAI1684979.1 DUF4670 multi-domain protein [Pyrenophora tritici-repentis]